MAEDDNEGGGKPGGAGGEGGKGDAADKTEDGEAATSTPTTTRAAARTFRYMRKRPTIIFYKPPEGKSGRQAFGFDFDSRLLALAADIDEEEEEEDEDGEEADGDAKAASKVDAVVVNEREVDKGLARAKTAANPPSDSYILDKIESSSGASNRAVYTHATSVPASKKLSVAGQDSAAARIRKKSMAPTVRRLRGDSSDNLVKLSKPLTVKSLVVAKRMTHPSVLIPWPLNCRCTLTVRSARPRLRSSALSTPS